MKKFKKETIYSFAIHLYEDMEAMFVCREKTGSKLELRMSG